MPRGKKRSPVKAVRPAKDIRGGEGAEGGLPVVETAFVDVEQEGATPLDQTVRTLQAANCKMDSRMGKIESGMQTLASLMGSIQATMEKREATGQQEGRSRKRQQSPLWLNPGNPSSYRQRDSSSSSRSPSPTKRGKDKTPFDTVNFLPYEVKCDNFESLMLANVRTLKLLAFDGEDILALINHIELICEKAMTKVYRSSALVNYDKSVRDRANVKGPSEYQIVMNSDVLRYFSYDSTVVATNGNRKNAGNHASSSSKKTHCFAFNKSDKGCVFPNCRYAHSCIYCKSGSHGAWSCSSGSKGGK